MSLKKRVHKTRRKIIVILFCDFTSTKERKYPCEPGKNLLLKTLTCLALRNPNCKHELHVKCLSQQSLVDQQSDVVVFFRVRCLFLLFEMYISRGCPTIFEGEVACTQFVRFKPPSRQKTPSLEDNGGISLLS